MAPENRPCGKQIAELSAVAARVALGKADFISEIETLQAHIEVFADIVGHAGIDGLVVRQLEIIGKIGIFLLEICLTVKCKIVMG